ncbi:MAG: murein L,D-transpeptidase family protein [Phycisphaerae bacterium]
MLMFAAAGMAGTGSCRQSSHAVPGGLPPMKAPHVLVEKSQRRLTLYDGAAVVKVYRCCTGRAAGDKEVEGDRKTPEGDFRICYKNPQSKFTLSLGLSYPDERAAARGLRAGLITREEHDRIVAACRALAAARLGPEATSMPGHDWEKLWKTRLGGEIMIHGKGAEGGTIGCIGVDDADIRELYPALPIGTPVRIVP